eukprot:TRINITY_DN105_c0_g1_i1.p1 TRINITY_DN105_c0_g1~~TRINITY_DN105_c0_g1_i1.p1  ORF type:complete len:613 (-),score=153.76 TRINITY_DN105_c0_g1_i1:138-1976(-)
MSDSDTKESKKRRQSDADKMQHAEEKKVAQEEAKKNQPKSPHDWHMTPEMYDEFMSAVPNRIRTLDNEKQTMNHISLPFLHTATRVRLTRFLWLDAVVSTICLLVTLILLSQSPAKAAKSKASHLTSFTRLFSPVAVALACLWSWFFALVCYAPTWCQRNMKRCLSQSQRLRWVHVCVWISAILLIFVIIILTIALVWTTLDLHGFFFFGRKLRMPMLILQIAMTTLDALLFFHFTVYVRAAVDCYVGRPLFPYKNIALFLEASENEPWYMIEMESLRKYLRYAPENWHYITASGANLSEAIKGIEAIEDCLVINTCDSSVFEGLPSIRVCLALEEKNIPYIGAGSEFVQTTVAKVPMKQEFAKHGVTTPLWIESLEDAEKKTKENPGMWPLFVKTDGGNGSFMISEQSVVHNMDELRAEWARLLKADEWCQRFRLFAEQYIVGPEFTVFVYGSKQGNLYLNDVYALDGVERRWPTHEGFRTYEQYLGVPKYFTCVPDAKHQPFIKKLAKEAYVAVGGDSFGRVDIRQDIKTGKYYVLEVNAYPLVGEVDFQTISMAAIFYHADLRAADMLLKIIPRRQAHKRDLSELEKSVLAGKQEPEKLMSLTSLKKTQ